ncbi:MAG: TolC family protein [Bacteroidia bacterium]|nr:TolC family protein [Bacteroidia bacterium]
MKRIITSGLLSVILLATPGLMAQEYAYTLEECITYAIENNKTIQNARFDEYISAAKVKEILSLGYPQISGAADLQYFVELPTSILPGIFNPETDPVTGEPIIDPVTGEPVPGAPIPLQFGFPWNANLGFSANQLVFDGTYFIGLKASKTFVELAEKNTDRTREETALAVSKAYFQALIAGEQMNLLDANISRVEKLFEETRALNEEGFVEKIDVDRLEINYTNLKLEKARIGRYAEMSMNLLKFQMGLPIQTKLTLTETAEELKARPIAALEESDFRVENRVEYSILQTQQMLENYNLRRYRAGYIPSLYAFGSYQWNAQRNEFNLFNTNESWYPVSVVGLKLNVPIFDGFQKRQQVQQSMLALKKIENGFSMLEQSIALEVSSSHANLLNAYQTLETSEQNKELAQRVYAVSQVKYKEGVGSSLEVNEAESQLKMAESAYLNGLFEFFMAKIDLQKARGEFSRFHKE